MFRLFFKWKQMAESFQVWKFFFVNSANNIHHAKHRFQIIICKSSLFCKIHLEDKFEEEERILWLWQSWLNLFVQIAKLIWIEESSKQGGTRKTSYLTQSNFQQLNFPPPLIHWNRFRIRGKYSSVINFLELLFKENLKNNLHPTTTTTY